MRVTTETGTRLVSEVRRVAKFARRDAGGRLEGVDQVEWTAYDDLVPASLAASMAEEAVRAAAPQIEAAAREAIDRWFADNVVALPELAEGELAKAYRDWVQAGAMLVLPQRSDDDSAND